VQFEKQAQDGFHWIDYLNQMGLSGQSVVVEITEGLLLDAKPSVQNQLYAYRDAGIQVALDDFGVGYSSLAYLNKFDIDFLKIDQSFTRNLAEGSSDLALCEAIIVMAHKLGLKVIAEGIETREQLQLLQAAGCDFGQGYLFSKPVASDVFEALFNRDMSDIKPATKTAAPPADSSIARLFNPNKT
jgi:EAL domain-containing protein (putative c-di-GMP-specific phosphodiesterase class I)